MSAPLLSLVRDRIGAKGPITVAEYVELALYHEPHGYYATAGRRSGARGDFITSVDLGPVFGELLASQLAETILLSGDGAFDLVEAGAGNGSLSRDVLEALSRTSPVLYKSIRLHLVERAVAARTAQTDVLGEHASRLVYRAAELPGAVRGVIFANELLDALSPHLVVMREDGLREVYVTRAGDRLGTQEGAPSTSELERYLEWVGARLEPGWYAEVNLRAVAWVEEAARALERGFLLLIDYGHEARLLYSASHAGGTLTTFRRHVAETRDGGPGWLVEPGTRDITSHVDLTGVRQAAERSGLDTVGTVDQSYFLLSLARGADLGEGNLEPMSVKRRLALKALVVPGGIGSTHKVMVFARGVERPRLKGLSGAARLT